MKRSPLRLALAVSDRVYRGLVCLFPAAFRRTFGPRMAQLFRQCCQEALEQQGLQGLVQVWLQMLADISVNLVLEWSDTLSQQARRSWPSLLTPLLGGLAGYFYLHMQNQQGLVLFLLLCISGAGLLGYLRPKGAWEGALLIGAGVPGVRLIDLATGAAQPCHLYLMATVLASVCALLGASGSVALRAMIRRWFGYTSDKLVWLRMGTLHHQI